MLHGIAINVKNLQPGDLVVYGSEVRDRVKRCRCRL
jgi:hypothetical protein